MRNLVSLAVASLVFFCVGWTKSTYCQEIRSRKLPLAITQSNFRSGIAAILSYTIKKEFQLCSSQKELSPGSESFPSAKSAKACSKTFAHYMQGVLYDNEKKIYPGH